MFGENVKKKPLQELGKVVSAFQEQYEKGKAGAPTNMQVFKSTMAAEAKGGRVKDMKLEPAPVSEDKTQAEQTGNAPESGTQAGPLTVMKPPKRTEGEKAEARQAKKMSRLRQGLRKTTCTTLSSHAVTDRDGC
jgi:hypothetical protein